MKKIINGLVYDTNTAKEIGEWSNGYAVSDFKHIRETLYKKRTGEYFLYGRGGPMSKYAMETGSNSWSGGEKIIPLEYERARKWGEDSLDADDYIAEFGDPGEGGDALKSLHIKLPANVYDKLDLAKAKSGNNMTEIVIELIEKYL